MNRKRTIWIIIGALIFVNLLISGFVLMQPAAQDILEKALDTAQTVTDGHAVVSINFDTPDKDSSGMVEVWARRGEEGPGAFRMEVLEASDEKAQGAVIVSNGETLWAFSPAENKVFVGTPEEAKTLMEANESFGGAFGQFHQDKEYGSDGATPDHPQNAEEAVQKLAEYFNIAKSGRENVAGETADRLELEPISGQIPAQFAALGGLIHLWIGRDSSLPLAVSYTGGSLGDFSATVQMFEANTGVDEALFTFTVPGDADIVTFADLEPQTLTLEEAVGAAEFQFKTPSAVPAGATLVDILDVRGTIVLRYTLPAGGSFTVSQGIAEEEPSGSRTPSTAGQAIEVRGTAGQLFEGEDGTRVLLTWVEGDLRYAVAGDLTAEDALAVAESLE